MRIVSGSLFIMHVGARFVAGIGGGSPFIMHVGARAVVVIANSSPWSCTLELRSVVVKASGSLLSLALSLRVEVCVIRNTPVRYSPDNKEEGSECVEAAVERKNKVARFALGKGGESGSVIFCSSRRVECLHPHRAPRVSRGL